MKLLTINGGGALGIIPAYILTKIEAYYKKPINSIFDMCAGVSTGSIISAMLSLGISASDVLNAYESFIPDIFSHPAIISELFRPKYDSSKLEKHVKAIVKGNFKDTHCKLMMHAVCISDPIIDLKFWKSWDEEDQNEEIANAVIASCSAPTYFKPKVINGRTYVDGGIANNDISMCAIANSLQMGSELNSISLLNLSPSISYGFSHSEKLGGLDHWIKKIIPLLMDASAPMSRYQCKELLGNRYMNVTPNFNHPLDTKDVKLLMAKAEELWGMSGDNIIKYIDSFGAK